MNAATTLDTAIPISIVLGYHKLTAYDMATAVRARIDARPRVKFAELTVGMTYFYRSSASESGAVFIVVKVTPGGKQAQVRQREESGFASERRIYVGSYGGDFVELDETLIALLGVTHRSVVEDAVHLGFDVPARVRCEHPDLFCDIPKRFDLDRGPTYIDKYRVRPAAERVKDALSADWGERWPKKPVCARAVDEWIERAHGMVAQFRDDSIRRMSVNPATREDYERQWREFEDLVDFYRWLRPHVSPGGAFYVKED